MRRLFQSGLRVSIVVFECVPDHFHLCQHFSYTMSAQVSTFHLLSVGERLNSAHQSFPDSYIMPGSSSL